jgi:hypothetical protein
MQRMLAGALPGPELGLRRLAAAQPGKVLAVASARMISTA